MSYVRPLAAGMVPHDDKTPHEIIAHEIDSWVNEWQPGHTESRLAVLIIESLVYKAYFEESEGALRWLDPDGDILARLLEVTDV